jgi:hypothetical protein
MLALLSVSVIITSTTTQRDKQMTNYSNTALRTTTLNGGTVSDQAIEMWDSMNHMQRYAVMQNVKAFKDLALRSRACINYIADFML